MAHIRPTHIEIQYTDGSAMHPQMHDGWNIVVHVCNNQGGWGAGFVLAVSARCPAAEHVYREWARQRIHALATGRFKLGEYQIVPVPETANRLFVCNLIGQVAPGRYINGHPPVRYNAIKTGLRHLAQRLAKASKPAHVHMPRIGAGLAGGDWDVISEIIQRELCDQGIPVTVYNYTRPTRPPARRARGTKRTAE